MSLVTSAPGLSESEATTQVSRHREWLVQPRLDNIGAMLGDYEILSHTYFFARAGIDRFCQRGLGPGARYVLLGRRGP